MGNQPTAGKEYCNVLAIQSGLDPAGHAGYFEDAIVIETPLPWKHEMYDTAGALPQALIDLLALWLERYRAGQPYNHRLLMIAPDPEYSRKGYRRVMFYTRDAGPFAQYAKREYLLPKDLFGPFALALYEARHMLAQYEQYRTPETDATRDILVCTHGTVDVACAKFGYPLYRHLRNTYAAEHLRVWRVSHFGGHLFAPTLVDMPTAHYWAYVEEEQAQQIIERNAPVAALRGHYRGWSGVDYGLLQVAEREMWQREGWAWFDYLKSGEVLAQDTNEAAPQWADVQMTYRTLDGTEGIYTAHVELTHRIATKYSTEEAETHAYPQYAVTKLEKQASRERNGSQHSAQQALEKQLAVKV
ncbi:MAG: sucrase ferredoxin [Chloroflexi bacterium]|nr:sucrase ferredoxin [Chloroflexota bacterium]